MDKQGKVSLWHRLFPPPPDFSGMLTLQLVHARKAMDKFSEWCDAPREDVVEAVFQIEKDADDVRLHLVTALGAALNTPLDREDLNDFSRLLDDIVDAVRNSVRECSALKVVPDDPMRQMITNLQNGLAELQNAIGALPKDRRGAFEHARKAQHVERLNERVYTRALAALLETDDFRIVLRQREAYRLLSRMSELIALSAEQLVHAIHKLG